MPSASEKRAAKKMRQKIRSKGPERIDLSAFDLSSDKGGKDFESALKGGLDRITQKQELLDDLKKTQSVPRSTGRSAGRSAARAIAEMAAKRAQGKK